MPIAASAGTYRFDDELYFNIEPFQNLQEEQL